MSTAYNCECRFKVEWEDLAPSVQARFKKLEDLFDLNLNFLQNYYTKMDLRHRLRPPLRRNTSYAKGDVCFHDSLPSYAYLECVQAGITGPDDPSVLGGGGNSSLLPPDSLPDGTALFVVRDIRCKYRTGEIVALMGTPKEQDYLLLCDGSTISSNLYPELVSVLGSNTLPNLISRFLEGSNTSGQYKSAGLPNITGEIGPVQFMNIDMQSSLGQWVGSLKLNDNGPFGSSYFGDGFRIEDYKKGGIGYYRFTLDASKENSIYGNSNTVQPRTMTVKYYICYAG